MTNHRIILILAAAIASVTSLYAAAPQASITVENPLPQPREEMVEIEASSLPAGTFIIKDGNGIEVPWQKTYDGKVIFPVSVAPSATATYTVTEGKPAAFDEITYAAFYPERVDDIAWENDYAAYRAYGPAFGATGGAAYGYDVFTKSTSRPVVPERYFKELVQKVSYHVDHGDGMDVYDVGATLGGGASAPIARDGSIIFPRAFSEYKILDNGPLRTTIELVYEYGGGKEVRTITLDAGTPFNHTVSRFTGFDVDSVAAGIVVHKPTEHDYVTGKNFVAFSDPTTSPGGRGIGRIFIGVVNPDRNVKTSYRPLPEQRGKAVGHVLAVAPYRQGDELDYYWGSSWSKGRVMTFDRWVAANDDLVRRLKSPLKVTVKR